MDTRRVSFRSGFIVISMLFGLLLATPSWAWVQCGDTIGPNKIAYLKQDLTCNTGVDGAALKVLGNSILILGAIRSPVKGLTLGFEWKARDHY